ncbi:thioredoxin domain-containing protein [Nanchangia anserum]|uniref:Thioredoxin domain-containing protein n=1 Tax=Nanchangia anserum TaxID=2692125 RepID=A0A8I0GAD7_9ACTO|nr:thioredoxin domain-containing protein [Nanchangia anserum]MBD3689158.1 thioredoxin domain-containing protein [Nanchangia anserum]QOX81390.1 thioredoxin domain-containing protein [Nanchangia anserum]
MSRKSQPRSSNATMRAVQERRDQQRKRDRRTLVTISAAVIVVLLVLAGLVTWAVLQRQSDIASGEGASKSLTLSTAIKQDRGMVLGADGPGKATAGAPVVELYFDYSCAHCVDFEHRVGKDVMADVAAGKYTLKLHPVLTEALPYQYPATELSLRVYQSQPDKFTALHEALTEEAYQAMVNRDYDPLTNDPVETVRKVGKKVGIDDKILDTLSTGASQSILTDWSKAWTSSGLSADGKYGTPMFVRDGKMVQITSIDDALAKMRGE